LPYVTMKNVVSDVSSKCNSDMLTKVLEHVQVSSKSLLYQIIFNISLTTTSPTVAPAAGLVGNVTTELKESLDEIIGQISAAKDKMQCIRQLQEIRAANPLMDIHKYLEANTSSTLRKFIVDSLVKLTIQETQAVLHTNSIVSAANSQITSSPSIVTEKDNKVLLTHSHAYSLTHLLTHSLTYSLVKENSSQPLVKNQILSKPSCEPKLSQSEPESSNDIAPSSSNSPSPRSQNFNAIRKSLNQLSLSLEVLTHARIYLLTYSLTHSLVGTIIDSIRFCFIG